MCKLHSVTKELIASNVILDCCLLCQSKLFDYLTKRLKTGKEKKKMRDNIKSDYSIIRLIIMKRMKIEPV